MDFKKKRGKRSLKRVRFKSLKGLKKYTAYNNNYNLKDY